MKPAQKMNDLMNNIEKAGAQGFQNNRRPGNQKSLISKNRSLPAFPKSQIKNYSKKKEDNANLLLTVHQAKIIQK